MDSYDDIIFLGMDITRQLEEIIIPIMQKANANEYYNKACLDILEILRQILDHPNPIVHIPDLEYNSEYDLEDLYDILYNYYI